MLLLAGAAGAVDGPELDTVSIHLKRQGVGTERSWFFSVARRGEELWAVGSRGILLQEADSSEWTQQVARIDRMPLDIAFSSDGAGVVVGQEGSLWELEPQSRDWTARAVDEQQRFFTVAASSSGEFVTAGAFGAIWRRPAASKSWERVPTPWEGWDGPHIYGAHFVDQETAVLVGERGSVLVLRAGRLAEQAEHGDESLFSVVGCGGALVTAGQQGLVLIGRPSEWQSVRIPENPDLYALGCLDDGTVVAGSHGFLVVGSLAEGEWAWRRFNPNPVRIGWYSDILVGPSGELLLAGQGDLWKARIDSNQ